MDEKHRELQQIKAGVSVLAACVVQTINESDTTFQDRFLLKLRDAYIELRDNSDGDVTQQLELLSWTRQHLTGFSPITGQGKPFLEP
ncbi:hypothetical protein [Neorhizobium sp. AL 9.2.2]|uniref:hypothetical protein n=1 Tax=Neorhizobium sp. AL 9.2.2 TaxID=2712894 RepID=UPI00157238EC|nr:hypothetical protein [Neorhizobium sp. AL 9.2.2]NSY17245.1 hypothetical protein [Neorhizobium sp. AL 9.2.2]